MKLKTGVSLKDVCWQIFYAAVVVEEVYKEYGQECVITSANDGKHGPNTLHHHGKAIDIRTWTVAGRELEIASKIRARLPEEYDVVVEPDHLHLEWDPK